MSDLLEWLYGALFVLCILALWFLFKGEPSIWDVLHERAIHALTAKGCSP